MFDRPELQPEFAGNFEPVDNAVTSIDAALVFCKQDMFWRRKHSIISRGMLFHTNPRRAGTVTLEAAFDPSFDWFLLFKGLLGVTRAHYGYLHLVTDEAWDRSHLAPQDLSDFHLGALAKTLEGGFKELGWANYFGSRWKQEINAIKLANAASLMELVDGGYIFAITDNIADVKADYHSFDVRRRAAKEAFVSGFFCAPARP